MFIFPLMSLAERTDDISSLAVQTSTTEFVDNIRTTGKVTLEQYEQYLSDISSTGNSFDVEFVIAQLDENQERKQPKQRQQRLVKTYITIYIQLK